MAGVDIDRGFGAIALPQARGVFVANIRGEARLLLAWVGLVAANVVQVSPKIVVLYQGKQSIASFRGEPRVTIAGAGFGDVVV